MLTAVSMKTLIILFQFYFASSIINALWVFFIVCLRLYFCRFFKRQNLLGTMKNPFVKILINGFFVSTPLSQKSDSKIFKLYYLIFKSPEFKIFEFKIFLKLFLNYFTLKNFSISPCTLLCTYTVPTLKFISITASAMPYFF